MDLENVILDIINDISTAKELKNMEFVHCTKVELKKELNAQVERILEKLVDDGSVHEGPLSSGVYFQIN